MKQIRQTKQLGHNHVRHFTRCKTFMSTNVEERGHVYAIRLDHPYLKQQARDYGRIHHECVFCGESWKKTNSNQKPHDGVTVDDVINNDFVRKEAETRNISVRNYKVGQEQ